MEKRLAQELLKTAIGDPRATFRDGQWEAIDALVNHRRKLLVVQRTGWGKSSVYFIGALSRPSRAISAQVLGKTWSSRGQTQGRNSPAETVPPKNGRPTVPCRESVIFIPAFDKQSSLLKSSRRRLKTVIAKPGIE